MTDIILDTLLDSLKTLPFLFLAYLVIELIEHKADKKVLHWIHQSGKFGPYIGGLLGIIPQCGFSAAVSNLYAAGVVTKGTLIAVFLSTSDEMLPILLASNADIALILKILAVKLAVGIIVGVATDFFARRSVQDSRTHISGFCEQEHCNCGASILKAALHHTIKIFLFLVIVSLLLNVAVALLGEDKLRGFILNLPIIGEALSGLIGLIPNCAASVVITQLYLEGGMSAGAMLSGLLVGSGVGLLVLFKSNKNMKDNFKILGILYVSGVAFGILGGALPIF